MIYNKKIYLNLILVIFKLNCILFAQSYDKSFYDKKTLYENAELLQLSDYQKLILKNEMIEMGNIDKFIDTTEFYFDEQKYDNTNANNSSLDSNNQLQKNSGYSFHQVSKKLNSENKIISKNQDIKNNDNFYFDINY